MIVNGADVRCVSVTAGTKPVTKTGVAQLVERATFNRVVKGSIPFTGAWGGVCGLSGVRSLSSVVRASVL